MKYTRFNTTVKLSLMMLFQHMMFAVWWVPFAAYLANINITGMRNALMLSSMAIGCIISPLIGKFADRFFSSEKLLACLNFFNALLLILAGLTTNPELLFVFIYLAMLVYMPTWALTSSIAMTHSPSEQFPHIRVFGSIGFVISGIFSVISVKLFHLDFDGTNTPLYFGGVISLIASVINLTLPKTPPTSEYKKRKLIDSFGLGTLKLMRDKNFALFIILSFLSMIPFSMYWSYGSEFLLDNDYKFITLTMNLGQLMEMLIMPTVPFAIRRIGLKKTMALGLLFLFIRYMAFYTGVCTEMPDLYFVGILVHGFIFSYFYVGGQIYIDKKAPAELKAQAQGFIFLVTFGLGLLAGNFVSRQIIENFSWVTGDNRHYDWETIWKITTLTSMMILLMFIFFFKNDKIEVNKIKT
jgi:nucleoside transporter